jgi:hypothetical protein
LGGINPEVLMAEAEKESAVHGMGMIVVPALISLAVTVLRLAGELRHWSDRWFSSETGGIQPSGVSWVVGITWLAAVFGVYFAVRLVLGGHGPRSLLKALIFAGIGVVIFLGTGFCASAVQRVFNVNFPQILIFVWLFWITAGALQYFGWPELFKILLAYGYAARIPVAVVMLLAMAGNWGTHYDYVGMPAQFNMPLLPRYLWLAFFPQLVGWIGFTITLGTFSGTVATAILSCWPTSGGDVS